MKKTLLTIAIILGLGISSYAQTFKGSEADDSQEFGLFGFVKDGVYMRGEGGDDIDLELPGQHGLDDDQDAPLGSGIAVLMGLGAAYAFGKRRKE